MTVVLVVNAGSSSIKVSTFQASARGLERELRGQVSGLGTEPRIHLRRGDTVVVDRALEPDSMSHAQAFEQLVDQLRDELRGAAVIGVGHRVVHGGAEFMAPTIVDAGVLDRLVEFEQLAPLQQPHNLAAIRLLLARMPGVPQVACFDTAFHRSIPEIAQLYALPARFADAGVRRYGFHGLSYEYVASVLPALDARAAEGRTVVFHLGNGASMCAMHAGRSVATTMGFTALEGLPMGTRCGSIDPGVLLYLLGTTKLEVAELEHLLYHESGLLGLSGVSSDMRDLCESNEPAARLAVDVFAYRAQRELGSLAAALGGLDAVVFTAGIGENQPEVRRRICAGAQWLGIKLDEAANQRHGPCISVPGSRVSAWVVRTDEETMIARHVARIAR